MQISTFSSGLDSLQSAQRRVQQAASEIAGIGQALVPQSVGLEGVPSAAAQRPTELSGSLLALQDGRHEAQAGAKLIATADQLLGTLLDTRA